MPCADRELDVLVGRRASARVDVAVVRRRRACGSTHAASNAAARPMPPLMQSVASPRRAPRRFISCSEGGRDPRAGGADRVAERDGAAVHVQALGVEAQLAVAGQHLGREGLVHLDEVEVVEAQRQVLEQPLHRRHHADAHDVRIDARRGHAQQPGQRLHLQRVARSRGASPACAAAPSVMPEEFPAVTVPPSSLKTGGSLPQRRQRGLRARVLVARDLLLALACRGGHGHDLGVEAALRDRPARRAPGCAARTRPAPRG